MPWINGTSLWSGSRLHRVATAISTRACTNGPIMAFVLGILLRPADTFADIGAQRGQLHSGWLATAVGYSQALWA